MRVPSLAFVLVPLLLLACDREPVAPDIAPPLLSPTKGELGEFAFYDTDNFERYVSCANDGAGESLHWSGPYRLAYRFVGSDSGNELLKFSHIEYLDGYSVKGVTSGDVWTILETRTPNTLHFQHNGNLIKNIVFLELYENQDGDRIFIQTTLQFTRANGAWRVARIGINACNLR
jgi:hypothetical protein